jgi:fatty acid/phospholipid biosynthesis enzyme
MDLKTVRGVVHARKVRLAIDAMGGDHAPDEVVAGALLYAAECPDDDLILVGDPERVRALVGASLPPNVVLEPASQVIEMHEQPALALREKRDASILVACDLVKRGQADAVITAGHTGAGMAAAVLRLGRVPVCPAVITASACSTSARTRIRPPRTSSNTRTWDRSLPSGPLA